MKALVLAAGYGTRLERDLKADSSGKYAHLQGVPKPLMPIGGKPLISRWMECLQSEDSINEVFVVVSPFPHRSYRLNVRFTVHFACI
jgi:NDP-sugar pyrophosphorylase family protein